jgi:predicted GIY-YIG superfamily endonuclease
MSNWCVYILINEKGRSYIGSTTDVRRRLRQHNGELVGGAKSTSRHKPWEMRVYVSGFKNRSEACRWEKLLKLRARGYNNRVRAMVRLVNGICPPGKRHYTPPENLRLEINI